MMEGGVPMDPVDRDQSRGKGSRVFTMLFLIVAALVVLGAVTLFQRRTQYQALAKETETLSIPTVAVIHASVESAEEDLVLPGTMQAYVESPIYARTNGYLKKWYHDIGSRVHQGDLLVDIDTPEVDQQLSQARADLNTAQANANLSKITASRYQELIKTDGVSKQEVDNAVGDMEAKLATVKSAEANVRRLEELESFKHIYAPFSGVVTRRSVDTGTLINAGNGGTSQQLFFLAQTDPIRVYVSVPETYAASIRAGLGAYLELTACLKPTRPPFAPGSAPIWSLPNSPARNSKAKWSARRSPSNLAPVRCSRKWTCRTTLARCSLAATLKFTCR